MTARSRPPAYLPQERPPQEHQAQERPPAQHPPVPYRDQVTLVDLLDRVLAKGVVVSGELTLSIAEVDLVHVSLRALLSSVRPGLFDPPGDGPPPGPEGAP